MDKALLAQLRAKHPDALTGAVCRTSTFINPNKMDLGHREWLEANRLPGHGWVVRHMAWKPAVEEGDDARIAQTYLSQSNKSGQGMAFIDALLKLNEYEMAQPLLGYFSDPDDTGAVTGSTHYHKLAAAEGIAFKGNNIILPQSGVITEDGEFDVATINAVFDAANRVTVKRPSPNYQRDLPLQNYGDLSVCSHALQQRLIEGTRKIEHILEHFGSRGVLHDCSKTISPFYKPQFSIFEKGLNETLAQMHEHIKNKDTQGSRFDLVIDCALTTAVNYLEFHALRLSVAWMREEIRNHPPHGDRARVRKDMNRAIARCAEILKIEEIPGAKHDQLLDFDITHARCEVLEGACQTVELSRIAQWLGTLVRRPRFPSPPPPRPRTRYHPY